MIRPLPRRAYADTPLGQLHYAEAGTGDPILLLHQTPRSLDEYAELQPLLAASRRAIAMDMYGFGASAKPDGPQTIEHYAEGALALVDALGLRQFAVMGHHTGSIVAVEVAAAAPDRVTAAVLSSPSLADAQFRKEQAVGPGVDTADRRQDGSHLIMLWGQRAPYYPPDATLLDRYIRDALAPGVDPVEGHLACARYVMEDRIGLVTAPTLILGATADPFAFPDVERTRAALVHASALEVHVVEGGMVPLLEQRAEEIAPVVRDFLDEHAIGR